MRIFMIADAGSVHVERWVKSLINRNIEVLLYSFLPPKSSDLKYLLKDNLIIYKKSKFGKILDKLGLGRLNCFEILKHVKQNINKYKPDILHSHYATTNSLYGALTGFHPFLISVWGSDIYYDPYKGLYNEIILKFCLSKADIILSTSHVMAKETKKFTNKKIFIIPFGVDINLFKPLDVKRKDEFIIGNVKTLKPVYAIDILIQAASIVIKNNKNKKIILHIYGDGPQKQQLIKLAKDLGIGDKVEFKGYIINDKLPEIYNSMSVSVSLSDRESFGVVAVEAMSCGCPVITSDADGFTEVVENGTTGLIVPKRDPIMAAAAIQKLIDDSTLRQYYGEKGRDRVVKYFNWENNVTDMVKIYESVLNH